MKSRQCLMIIGIFFWGTILGAQEQFLMTQDMHIKISEARTAMAPEQWGKYLFLTWQAPLGSARPRLVAAVFRHDPANKRHIFSVNRFGVFYIFYAMPPELVSTGIIEYRINVDGVWLNDANVSTTTRNEQGVVFSSFQIPQPRLLAPTRSPNLDAEGNVIFNYRSQPGRSIFFVSNINNWDPFMHPMVEDPNEPGLYKLKLPLIAYQNRQRQIFYYFQDGVMRVLDPLNPVIGEDQNGQQINVFDYNPPPPPRFRSRGS
jgi:hypothetical protein